MMPHMAACRTMLKLNYCINQKLCKKKKMCAPFCFFCSVEYPWRWNTPVLMNSALIKWIHLPDFYTVPNSKNLIGQFVCTCVMSVCVCVCITVRLLNCIDKINKFGRNSPCHDIHSMEHIKILHAIGQYISKKRGTTERSFLISRFLFQQKKTALNWFYFIQKPLFL